jgi:hypothetical protein
MRLGNQGLLDFQKLAKQKKKNFKEAKEEKSYAQNKHSCSAKMIKETIPKNTHHFYNL